MSKQNYWEKLQHPQWQKRRLEIMEKSGFACSHCETKDVQLNVHHLYYISGREPWQYPDWSLKCLCKNCHKDRHEKSDELEDGEYEQEMFEYIFGFMHDGKDGDDVWHIATTIAEYRIHHKDKTRDFLRKIDKYATSLFMDELDPYKTLDQIIDKA